MLLRFLCALIILAGSVSAGEWVKLKSANFEIYTSAGEKRAREALNYFEQVRDLFVRMWPKILKDPLPVRIVAFSSDKEYKPYRMNSFATAYYLGDQDRDYIVMSGIGPESFPVAAHEYMHLLTRHAQLNLPIWLNEGFADVTSMIQPEGDKVMVGVYYPGRMAELQQSRWMPLDQLINVSRNSPEYNEKQRAGVFYAESWLLTHMIYLSDGYRQNFGQFLARIVNGAPTAEAFQQGFGKSIEEVSKDLHAYLRNGRINVIPVPARLQKATEKPTAETAPEVDLHITFALLLSRGETNEQATAAYRKLEADFPKSWEVQEALAHRALYTRNRDEARQHYERAIALGANEPTLYLTYAKLLQGMPAKTDEQTAVLKKALELNPDLLDAHYLLGLTLSNAGKYKEAIEQLNAVKKVKAEQAPTLFLALAYSYAHLQLDMPAKDAATKAKQYATSEADRAAADQLLQYLDNVKLSRLARPPVVSREYEPTEYDAQAEETGGFQRLRRNDRRAAIVEEYEAKRTTVEGKLVQMDCLDGPARLHIVTSGAKLALLIRDPKVVEIRGSKTGSVDLTCGAMKEVPVKIEYIAGPDEKHGTRGDVRMLEFQ